MNRNILMKISISPPFKNHTLDRYLHCVIKINNWSQMLIYAVAIRTALVTRLRSQQGDKVETLLVLNIYLIIICRIQISRKYILSSDAGRWKTLGGAVVIGGENMPSPVRVGLTDLQNIEGASGPPGPPGSGTTALRYLLNKLARLKIVTIVKQASSFNRDLRVANNLHFLKQSVA